MGRDPLTLLWDVRASAAFIFRVTAGLTLDGYAADELVRPAVERHFEIIGEALNRLRAADPDLAARITDLRRAIDFRNMLIHGYDAVEDGIVWRTIERNLPRLLSDVEALIAERGAP